MMQVRKRNWLEERGVNCRSETGEKRRRGWSAGLTQEQGSNWRRAECGFSDRSRDGPGQAADI